ncbi:MAG: hypothetical protein ACXVZW_12390 [Gaiellaceae bacterium]
MSIAPALPFLRRRGTASSPRRPIPPQGWGQSSVQAVEIFAPDRPLSDLLIEFAAPLFRAEIVPGCVWIVRVQPPSADTGWVLELLSLLERWLHAVNLPWVTVVYDGRSYLIRAAAHATRRTAGALAASPVVTA